MTNIVNSSNLPNNIRILNKNLASPDNQPKLNTGPTFHIPGPTLPKQVATAPILVNIS